MDHRTDLLVRPLRRNQGFSQLNTYTIELQYGDGRRLVVSEDVQFNLPLPESNDPDSIARFGQALFQRLFPGRLRHAVLTARQLAIQNQQPLRLRLALDPLDVELQAIPWELLHFPVADNQSRALPLTTSDHILFSRYIDSEQFPLRDPLDHRPIRMLIVLSEPSDLERWRLSPFDRNATEQDFRQRFRPFTDTGQLSFDILPRAGEAELRTALEQGSLQQQNERGYDIVLYLGHALFVPEYGTRLLLENGEQRRGRLVDGMEFARMLTQLPASHKPTMIALIACNSATVDLHAPLSNLAARLIADSGITAVLAMQRLVAIDLARDFTQHLTEILLRNGLIDLAVATARRRIYRPDSVNWSTPVLYTRLATGRLFQPSALLSYIEWLLQQEDFKRWVGDEYIDVGCIAIPAEQYAQLSQLRPENPPTISSTRDTLLNLVTTAAKHGKGQCIVLAGSQQSGQTTILRRVCYDLARQALLDVRAPVGVFVSLNGYTQVRGELRIYHHIVEQVRQQHPALANQLDALFRGKTQGPTQRPYLVFLLDDLDQVAESQWQELLRDLNTVRQRLPDQSFIIAAPQTFIPLTADQNITLLAIQPLDEQSIINYIRQRSRHQAKHIIERMRENRLYNLANDPRMLTLIFERLSTNSQQNIAYHHIIEEFLSQELRNLDNSYQMGNIAHESLYQLAWHLRWQMSEYLSLSEVFTILAQVRRNRDYSLEDLFRQLSNTQLLTIIGQQAICFTNSAVAAYCAAQALYHSPNRAQLLANIVALCADVKRQHWWEDVLYALVGLLDRPEELLQYIADSLRAGNNRLAVLAARCLEAIPPSSMQALPEFLRHELIDTCLLQLDERQEPQPERRKALVSALGKLDYPQVRQQLRRISVNKVRQTSSGPRYEYTNIRIAAARALRDLYLPTFKRRDSSSTPSETFDRASISVRQLRDDRSLIELMSAWLKAEGGRRELRHLLRSSPLAPERAIAAFALADVSTTPLQQLCDARFLLRVIVAPSDTIDTCISDDWIDTMWAAADALTLLDPEYVIPLLVTLIRRKPDMPDPAAQQIAYLAGRLRINQPLVIDWLLKLLITNLSQSVKARALQSLAWIGESAASRAVAIVDGERQSSLTVKQLIEEIALWRQPLPRFAIGTFRPAFSLSGDQAIYLRRKAIEALAWIGDRNTLRELDSYFKYWPLELRTQWYLSRASLLRG